MDWLDDLREFGPDIVAAACGDWRRTQSKRPTIADIRALCIRERHERAPVHVALPPPPLARVSEKHMQRARDEEARLYRENWANQLGYESFGQMLSIGLVKAVRNAPGVMVYHSCSSVTEPVPSQ